MDQPLLFALGVALVAATLVDVVWTALAVSAGGGPFTSRLTTFLWRRVPGARRSHRVLRLTGYGILVGLLTLWVLGLWAGVSLVFLADPQAVVDAATQKPASDVARVAYAAGALAGAGAGFVAGAGGWELANNLAAVIGLATVTLAVTYVFQIVTATTQKRALALHLAALGDNPAEIVKEGAGDATLGALGNQLTSLSTQLAQLARQHLALPVLHYLHAGTPSASIELAVARMDEALSIAEHGLDGVSAAVLRPPRAAIEEYVRTAPVAGPEPPVPPPPDLAPLEQAGVSVARGRLVAGLEESAERRSLLRGLVDQNGWSWERNVLRSG